MAPTTRSKRASVKTTKSSSSSGQKPKTESKKKPRKSKDTSSSTDPGPIELLRHQGLSLIRQSNALVPISRFPPEVLGSIFVFASNDEFEEHKTTRTRVYISSVSHYWREVAISIVALWRNLVLRERLRDHEIQTCSERARGNPLRLHIIGPSMEEDDGEYRGHWNKYSTQRLVDVLGRAESLEVNATPLECHDLDFPNSTTLAHLKLDDPCYRVSIPTSYLRSRLDDRGNEPLDMMSRLDTKFPNLLSLELVDHSVSLSDLRLPSSLLNLNIDNVLDLCWSEDVADVLDVLRNLHNLERLSLAHAMTDFKTPNALEHLDTVSLPRLKDFSFEGQVSTCIAFTKALQLPSSVRRKLVVHQRGKDSDRYDTHSEETTRVNALRLYNELITELAKLEAHFAHAFVLGGSGTWVLAWKHTQSLEDLDNIKICYDSGPVNSNCPADLELRFIESRHVEEADALRLESLLDQARMLTIYSGQCSLHAPSLLGHLDKLEVLTYAFAACTRNDQKRWILEDLTKHSPPLPQLRLLRLRQYSFVKDNLDRLLAVCRQRQELGAALDIQLRSCYEVTKAKVDTLRTLTKSVDWDQQKPEFRNWY
ncbi:hypothetical protein EIP86_000998 [Pleurotus ostreatoroseus]|nr:hypothetical protein EIP86_000998 [Pleurotus ostreatoroseus]